MSERSRHVDSAEPTIDELLDELNAVRLSRDWSFRQLAEDMSSITGLRISGQTLQPLLSASKAERSKPYDRTIHKIREYLQHLRDDEAKHDRPRKTTAAAAR